MLTVWGRRNASNVLPVMWTIGELGLEHERRDVGGSFGGVTTPDFLAMNPNGRIPVLEDDGFVLWESNAIVRHLCRHYGAGRLLPVDERGCALADQWMDWYKTTAYPDYIDLFWAIVRTEPPLRDPARIARLARSLGAALRILDAHLADRDHVLGDALTMADIPLGALVHRYFSLAVERHELTHVQAWYQRLCERPAYRQHVMFAFGDRPAEWYRLEMQPRE